MTESTASDDTGRAEAGCCREFSITEGGQAVVEFGDHRLNPIQLTVRAAAFRLLLDKGQPMTMTSIAKGAGVDVATTIAVLEGFAETGNVSIAGDRVIGIAGLSVEPTRHRVDVAAGRRWTWCALDAVGIVGAIGDGFIRSETADVAAELRIADGMLESTDLAVFVAEGYGLTSAVDQWCPLVNFFPNLESATAWAEANGVPGRSIPVTTISSGLIERWQSVLSHDWPESTFEARARGRPRVRGQA